MHSEPSLHDATSNHEEGVGQKGRECANEWSRFPLVSVGHKPAFAGADLSQRRYALQADRAESGWASVRSTKAASQVGRLADAAAPVFFEQSHRSCHLIRTLVLASRSLYVDGVRADSEAVDIRVFGIFFFVSTRRSLLIQPASDKNSPPL